MLDSLAMEELHQAEINIKILNSINRRILAARNTIGQNHLMDRRYLHTFDDAREADLSPIY